LLASAWQQEIDIEPAPLALDDQSVQHSLWLVSTSNSLTAVSGIAISEEQVGVQSLHTTAEGCTKLPLASSAPTAGHL
jgi:hypothetical protein